MCAVRLGRCVTNLGRGRATNIDIPTGRKLLDRVDKTVISFVGSCLSSLPNIRKVTTSQLTWRSGKLETVVAAFIIRHSSVVVQLNTNFVPPAFPVRDWLARCGLPCAPQQVVPRSHWLPRTPLRTSSPGQPAAPVRWAESL